MDSKEFAEDLRRELEKKTNKDLLIDVVIRQGVLDERTALSAKKIESVDDKVDVLSEKIARAMTLAESADEKANAVRKYQDKLTVGVITSLLGAVIALIVAFFNRLFGAF
ncbi:MAG: hypothetical protein RBT24_10020 [Arcobacteraceae bacterium]|jgi:Zn-dependent peptidase ImmA (M78 family)|nr:hypothetical protein [Arcobacteraceae bacterium]